MLGTGDAELNSKQIWSALKQSVITHFGDTGWGAVGASLNSEFILAQGLPCTNS